MDLEREEVGTGMRPALQTPPPSTPAAISRALREHISSAATFAEGVQAYLDSLRAAGVFAPPVEASLDFLALTLDRPRGEFARSVQEALRDHLRRE